MLSKLSMTSMAIVAMKNKPDKTFQPKKTSKGGVHAHLKKLIGTQHTITYAETWCKMISINGGLHEVKQKGNPSAKLKVGDRVEVIDYYLFYLIVRILPS